MKKDQIHVKTIIPEPTKLQSTPNASRDKFDPGQSLYVRAFKGYYQRIRRFSSWFLILAFIGLPWVSLGDRQAVLFDLSAQQFHLFHLTLWPQDLILLALVFMIAAFGLFFLTTFLGRIWCGFLCPQTVWTFLFIWFEEKIEGPANKRKRQDSLTLTNPLLLKKTLKHICWLGVSLFTALSFLGYFVPIKDLYLDIFSLNASGLILFWVVFFSLCTYGNAGWMRTIMCVHMCPYSRFQSAMFDQKTFIVAYDSKRGEQRAPRKRSSTPTSNQGDCIDCNLCVQVCPAGIDIREGLQYECISCGACIDACNHTMEKMALPKHLISFTTEDKLAGKNTTIFRPKLFGYGAIMLIMSAVFMLIFQTISPARLDVLRDRNQMYKTNQDGWIENTYSLKIHNKTQNPQTYQLSAKGLEGVQWLGKQQINLTAGEFTTLPIRLAVSPSAISSPISEITFVMTNDEALKLETESRFISQSF